jgi:hypothetical protein
MWIEPMWIEPMWTEPTAEAPSTSPRDETMPCADAF